jgi:hypothetical protein
VTGPALRPEPANSETESGTKMCFWSTAIAMPAPKRYLRAAPDHPPTLQARRALLNFSELLRELEGSDHASSDNADRSVAKQKFKITNCFSNKALINRGS